MSEIDLEITTGKKTTVNLVGEDEIGETICDLDVGTLVGLSVGGFRRERG